MKYLPLYYKWSEAKVRTTNMYLCNALPIDDELLGLVEPTDEDFQSLDDDGYSSFAWAEGNSRLRHPDSTPIFPPLRRNLLLLICAMNNEL